MTATTTVAPVSVDLSRPTIPLRRLVRVELRKLVDTRAGFWLIASIGVISLVVVFGCAIAYLVLPGMLDGILGNGCV